MLYPGTRVPPAEDDGKSHRNAEHPTESGTGDDADLKPRERFRTLGEDGFEAFYQQTARPLWGYLRRISGRSDLADDLLQEAFLRFLNRPVGVPRVVDDVAYLYRIATNLLRDRWRREQRERGWIREKLLMRDPWLVSHGGQQRVDLERGLAELAPRDRALLWLAHVDGYRHQEIAEILSLKAGSVRVMLFRARKKLAEKLETGKMEGTSR